MSEYQDKAEKESEEFWNSLTLDQKLNAFCAVARRIYQAEMLDQGTYRHALYGVFGFGGDAYAKAQYAGYFAIHEAICAGVAAIENNPFYGLESYPPPAEGEQLRFEAIP